VVLDDSDPEYDIHPWDQRTVYLDTVAVWTGSFNLSRNANYSLENGVIIHSPKIAREYFREFFQIVRYLDGHK
jgi:phosphatidylserine/phosphatidylglycerophosphate/cardiolipin synthase-like enzyme